MLQSLLLYWEILWRRRMPGDLPYSLALCLLTAIPAVLITMGINRYAADFTGMTMKMQIVEPGAPAYAIAVFVVALESLGYALLLRVFGFVPRTLQTITAVLGVSIFTGIAALALLLLGVSASQSGSESVRGVVAMAMIAVYIYDLYVRGWIVAQASERPVALSVGLVLLLQVLVMIVGSVLLGPRVAPLAPAAS